MKKIYTFAILITLFTSMKAQQEVIINVLNKSNSDTEMSFNKNPKIRDASFYSNMNKKVGDIERITDSTYVIKINDIKEPHIFYAPWRRNQIIIMTPGDTINAVLTPSPDNSIIYQARFYGKNQENYNKYDDLNKLFNKRQFPIYGKNTLIEFIHQLDSIYTVNTKIIEEQVSSPLLKNLMLNEEIADYFYLLSFKNSNAENKLTHENVLELKNKFFLGKIASNSPILMQASRYTIGMKALADFLTANIKSDHEFVAGNDTINKYFEGELREYLLAERFGRYRMWCTFNNTKDPDVDEWFDMYSGKMKEKEFNEYILFIDNRSKKINSEFPEEILNIRLISLADSSVVTFRELFDKYKDKQIVLDNWASWCGPCAIEIKVGRKNVEELKNRGNHFIYLSLDRVKDFDKATSKAKELGIIDNAYIVTDNFNSAYAKYLDIKHIPRFVLIDKEGRLKKDEVSNPSFGNFRDYR